MSDQVVTKLPHQIFTRKDSPKHATNYLEGRPAASITGAPVVVSFRRFIKSDPCSEEVPGIKNRDLVHAVAALYDQALPDVTEDVIYATICEKFARTIMILQDASEALECFKQRALHKLQTQHMNIADDSELSNQDNTHSASGDSTDFAEQLQNGASSIPENTVTLSAAKSDGEPEDSRFSDVFSDMDTSDEEEDEDEEEDFTKGVDEFLQDVKERQRKKLAWMDSITKNNCCGEPHDLIGIEHRLMGCLTFDRIYPKRGHKVMHLALIAVRKRFRHMLVGKFLTDLIRSPLISGKYDAIVVNADHKATGFFEKQGFSGDVLLNSKYEEIGDTWYNCKRMCYLPPYQSLSATDLPMNRTDEINYNSALEALDLKQMELDHALHQERSLQVFQSQALIMERLRKEVILLRAKVSAQQDTIEALKTENYAVREEKYNCEKEFLRLKLKFLTNAAGDLTLFSDNDSCGDIGDEQIG